MIEGLWCSAATGFEWKEITYARVARVLSRQNVIEQRALDVFRVFGPRLDIKQKLGKPEHIPFVAVFFRILR